MTNLIAALRACEAEVGTLTLTPTPTLLLTTDYWLLTTGCLVLGADYSPRIPYYPLPGVW